MKIICRERFFRSLFPAWIGFFRVIWNKKGAYTPPISYVVWYLFYKQLTCKFPNNNTCCYTYIQRVLGSELWNLKTAVAHVHNTLFHTFHLVAHDDRVVGDGCWVVGVGGVVGVGWGVVMMCWVMGDGCWWCVGCWVMGDDDVLWGGWWVLRECWL